MKKAGTGTGRTPTAICQKWGPSPRELNIKKFFTATRHCNYSSPWMGNDEVFLRYPVKRPFRLRVGRKDHDETCVYDADNDRYTCEHRKNCDGYIDVEDHVEICLWNAADVVGEDFEIIDFVECNDVEACHCHRLLDQ